MEKKIESGNSNFTTSNDTVGKNPVFSGKNKLFTSHQLEISTFDFSNTTSSNHNYIDFVDNSKFLNVKEMQPFNSNNDTTINVSLMKLTAEQNTPVSNIANSSISEQILVDQNQTNASSLNDSVILLGSISTSNETLSSNFNSTNISNLTSNFPSNANGTETVQSLNNETLANSNINSLTNFSSNSSFNDSPSSNVTSTVNSTQSTNLSNTTLNESTTASNETFPPISANTSISDQNETVIRETSSKPGPYGAFILVAFFSFAALFFIFTLFLRTFYYSLTNQTNWEILSRDKITYMKNCSRNL